jgi:antirestriction protein ArdC
MNVYDLVVEKILKAMEQGIAPWVSPYAGKPNKNLVSKKEYRGINSLLLNAVATANGFKSPYWATFKQATELGLKVKKGSKATMVVFWKDFEVEEEEEKTSKRFVLRYYNVFNASQLEGYEEKESEACNNDVLNDYCKREGIEIKLANAVASFYAPGSDSIVLAPTKSEYYDSNFAHECIHSTGHPKRLGRFELGFIETPERSLEELVAEIGASMLCSIMGKPAHIENTASYVSSWADFLREDKKTSIIKASSMAQKAVDYILNKK